MKKGSSDRWSTRNQFVVNQLLIEPTLDYLRFKAGRIAQVRYSLTLCDIRWCNITALQHYSITVLHYPVLISASWIQKHSAINRNCEVKSWRNFLPKKKTSWVMSKQMKSLWKAPASLQQEGCATHVCGDIRCCYLISSTTRHLSSAARAKRQTPISGFICSFNTPVPIFSHATANDNKWERWKTRDKRKHQNNKSTF